MVFDFGYRLRALRKQKKLTQTQVASRLNLSKTTISGYENNTKTPSVDTLIQLSSLYGVSTDYLLGIENRPLLLIDGISERQQEILRTLLAEFRTRQNTEH
ncbi:MULTISPECIES: helix-turn-helix domain-containing protein [Anaerotruncus]|uniref:helix-turn-helix domain-containing protein n=1 Tax=Anaerotruncus TaxID=244127 RepID=UPI00082CD380|nr:MULTISPECIES: helix-turn-helix transcriptional regulator [Anaerotruncus]RGX56920.1 XRE family transcriptional regulator [Anaerotruncus sp. AF02-27]